MSDPLIVRLRRAPRVLARLTLLRLRAALVHPVGCALVLGTALTQRLPTARRRRRRLRPRLAWGPVPLISISYWSQALRQLGFESQTVVTHHYQAFERASFDVYRAELLEGRRWAWLGDYRVMSSMLRRADVFVSFFNGGFLYTTPLWRLEAVAIRLAGKRLVVCPYGGDIAVPGYLGPFEDAFVADYPATVERAPEVRRRVDWLCARADLVVRNLQVGYLPRADVIWPQQVAVDTDLWAGDGKTSLADGRHDEVVVVHAPNHRALKGTSALEDAVRRLRAEGLRVGLDLLQGRPNEEVRRAVLAGDVVAEQFIGGYALFAIEGMSAGKPVLSNLAWMSAELRARLSDCPIVDATEETLTDRLRALVTDPGLREQAGRASREYALRHHSYAAVGERWARLLTEVWLGRQAGSARPVTSNRSPSASRT
jgi:glycosyltransferase involved in cell wall biosynthesis